MGKAMVNTDFRSQLWEMHGLAEGSLEQNTSSDIKSGKSELWRKTQSNLKLFKKDMEVVKSDAKKNANNLFARLMVITARSSEFMW